MRNRVALPKQYKRQPQFLPLPAELMVMHRVSTQVNNATIQGHMLIAPESAVGLPLLN